MGTGGVSLLIIFVVLCAVIFGTLSLFMAEADLNMSRRARNAVESFYFAEFAAVQKAAELAGIITAAGDETQLAVRLQEIDGIAVEPSWEGIRIRYFVPIDDIRTLEVTLLANTRPGEPPYTVLTWLISTDTSEWLTDDATLWDGGTDDDFFFEWDD